ncbi:MAG: hypothetical protein KDK55_02525 [Chlamydiia bacterium]|nr:hypothetical protein [Chlamydiia bacterium]
MFNTVTIKYDKSNIDYIFHLHEDPKEKTDNVKAYPEQAKTDKVAHQAFIDVTRSSKIICNGKTYLDFSSKTIPTSSDPTYYYSSIYTSLGDAAATEEEKIALTSRVFSLFNQAAYVPLNAEVQKKYQDYAVNGINQITTINSWGKNIRVTRTIIFKVFQPEGDEFYVGGSLNIQGTKQQFIEYDTDKLDVKAYITKPSKTPEEAQQKLHAKWF